ncbi:hypothetical protein Tco_1504336 [Tanacetum coccineum]
MGRMTSRYDSRDTLKLEDMLATLNSRKPQKITEAKGDSGEGLYVRGRSSLRDMEQGTYSACVVKVTGKKQQTQIWNLVNGADGRDYFVDFEEYEGGKILLGDGRECVCFRIKTKIDIAGQFLNKEGFSGRCSQSIKVIKVSLVGRTLKGRKQLGEFMGGRSRTVWSVQGMLESVKVKCISWDTVKGIVGNKLWRLDDVTSKVMLYRNIGTGSVQVLQGVEFEVEPQEDHTFEVEPHGNVDHVAVACDVIPSGRLWMKDVMDARSDVYAEIWATKGLLDKAKGNVLGMEIVRDQSGNTLRVSQSRFLQLEVNGKWSCIYAVGSQEYQMVCTRLDIASADVAMMLHMMAFSPNEAGYMTLTKAAKEAIWLKGLAIESGFELKISFKKGGGGSSLTTGDYLEMFQKRVNMSRVYWVWWLLLMMIFLGANVSDGIKFNHKLGMNDSSMYRFMMDLDGHNFVKDASITQLLVPRLKKLLIKEKIWYMVMLMMIIKQTHLSETSSSAGVKIHTIPSDKILNRSSERAFVDMSANCYGCVCPVSVVRGCMRLLWLTESRNTTCILFFDIQLTSFSQGTVSLQSAFRDIKGIRHDQLSENAVSSTAIILWITSWSYDLSIELSSEGRLFLDDLDERTLLVSNINLLLQWDIKNASFPSLIDWKRACDAASGQEKSGTASKRAMMKFFLGLQIHQSPKGIFINQANISDADHAGCLDTRKSTSGGIQFLGDKLVSWMSKKQNCTAMSSAEAEYVALSASCAQVMWMRTQLQDYGFNYNKIPLYCDSQSAIAISCNPVQHSRTKHIHTRYHFIKEQVENGIIELYFVRTEYQLADMFTKALPEDRFKYLVRRIGMRCLTPAELEVLTNESA